MQHNDSLSVNIMRVLGAAETPLSVYEIFQRLPPMVFLYEVRHVQNHLKTWRKRNNKAVKCHEVNELLNGKRIKWRYEKNRNS